jgi:hypothetical protein
MPTSSIVSSTPSDNAFDAHVLPPIIPAFSKPSPIPRSFSHCLINQDVVFAASSLVADPREPGFAVMCAA